MENIGASGRTFGAGAGCVFANAMMAAVVQTNVVERVSHVFGHLLIQLFERRVLVGVKFN